MKIEGKAILYVLGATLVALALQPQGAYAQCATKLIWMHQHDCCGEIVDFDHCISGGTGANGCTEEMCKPCCGRCDTFGQICGNCCIVMAKNSTTTEKAGVCVDSLQRQAKSAASSSLSQTPKTPPRRGGTTPSAARGKTNKEVHQ